MKHSKESQFNSGKIDFLSKAKILIPITFLVMFFGAINIGFKGLNYGVDFAGGTEIQLRFEQTVTPEEVRAFMAKAGHPDAQVQSLGDKSEFIIRTNAMDKKGASEEFNKVLVESFATQKPEVLRFDTVGPQVGSELKRNSLLAAVYSLILLLIYIGMRFDYKYAPGAVFCVFHDALLTLSIFAIFGLEVNVQTLASILTLIGYSLNDTIVTFDRIRENERLYPDISFDKIVNRSVNDTLSRTILTSFATFIAVLCLYIFSDGTIRQIAFTLGIGVIIGCYSTVYIASPLVIMFDRWEKKKSHELKTAKV
jgi:preprotein translocase subunit SecF